MKECFKCGEVKPLSDFYKQSKMKDGHLNKCKECTKRDNKANRDSNIKYYREYDRARGSRQSQDSVRAYRKKNPIKYAAHVLVGNRLRDGKLIKPKKCEECGCEDLSLHGHHDDYALPLEVMWLCAACHHKWHAVHGEGKNSN